MNYFKKIAALFLFLLVSVSTFAQGNFEKMGMQAFLKYDYKTAAAQLEKVDSNGPNYANVLKTLGYSYFQCGDFEKAITAYSNLIVLKPNDYSAYYYRGKARLNIANAPKESLNQMRESFYTSAIKDFSKAIEINGEEDTQILQNRGIAYKDYAIFKSYKIKKATEKAACLAIFNNATTDFKKILTLQPSRKDILDLMDYVKAQVASLK
ncbi:MAG: tetratricopeptide repeat protein [Pedobacter sp.]|nr:MAG: tetratricopeptide repeat protein [Pedobacter sp.]